VGELDAQAVQDAVAGDPDDVLPLLAAMARATDPVLRAKVQALVPRLVLERARSGRGGRSGSGRLRPVRGGDGDLDLDTSLEAIGVARAERRAISLDELTTSSWRRPGTAICLLLDRSGSMDGPQLVRAAMATAACALRSAGARNELAVVAFDRRTEVVVALREPVPPGRAVERVLGLRGHGMTSIDAALREAAAQLRPARSARRVTILLSDCRVTDDIDPVPAARALDELAIIPPAEDDDEARGLARRSGARIAPLHRIDQLPAILDDLLA